MPVLHKAVTVACKAKNDHPTKMKYDFFATKSDKINLLDFIFTETDLKIYDLASPYGQEISMYNSTNEIATKFDLENGRQSSVTFQLWTERFGGDLLFRKVDLEPKYCNGYTFRYSTEGWGLIQLYFGGLKDSVLFHSHIGHYNEKGALKWEENNHFKGRVDKWNWKEIEQVSRKIKYQIHNKMASRKIGSYGILPGAEKLSTSGIKLWGTKP
jgi:hypothetical protein